MNLTVGEIHFCGIPEPDILEMNTVLYQGFGGYTVDMYEVIGNIHENPELLT